jgi:lipoprotein-anchoring transpeptidase ErfK/SrfK
VTFPYRISLSAALVLACTSAACARQRDASPADAGHAAAPAPAPSRDLAAEQAAEDAAHHRALVEAAHAALDAGPWEGAKLGATNFVTSVLSAPLWPEDADGGQESVRLGYLRHGARVPVIPDPIVNDSCPDGWLELAAGGFVCGKNATLDPKNPRVRLAPHGPDLSRSLPYDYGVNRSNGTPLYRRVLSLEDRKKYEPWLIAAPPRPAVVDGGTSEDESDALDAGAVAASAPPAEIPDAAPLPWYLRDGGSKEITLEDLHGHGVLVRRMVRGFVLALDRDFKAAHAHWWRTTAGFAAPFERVTLFHPPADFRGAWLGGHEDEGQATFGGDAGVVVATSARIAVDASDGDASANLPGEATAVGFVRSSSAHALIVDPEKKKVAWGAALERRAVVELTDETYEANGATYRRTTRGTWVSMNDVQLATPSPVPSDLGEHEKWIDVDLTHQSLVAFEGTHPVFATLVSSGKRDASDKTKDHPTPTGTFRIQSKHVSSTMDGNIAADAPYSIEDVPWVMYFDGSYALHGAFWHANFGYKMSHGCVNLSPADARALFAWTEPHLPSGWHGVFAREPKDGTRIVIHE